MVVLDPAPYHLLTIMHHSSETPLVMTVQGVSFLPSYELPFYCFLQHTPDPLKHLMPLNSQSAPCTSSLQRQQTYKPVANLKKIISGFSPSHYGLGDNTNIGIRKEKYQRLNPSDKGNNVINALFQPGKCFGLSLPLGCGKTGLFNFDQR